MHLQELQKVAHRMGVFIDIDSLFDGDPQPGYWLLRQDTREGVWEDENFSTNLDEVEDKLRSLAAERGLDW